MATSESKTADGDAKDVVNAGHDEIQDLCSAIKKLSVLPEEERRYGKAKLHDIESKADNIKEEVKKMMERMQLGFHPWGLDVNGLGDIYITDHDHNKIHVCNFSKEKKIKKLKDDKKLKYPTGLVVSENEVIVASKGTDQVRIYDREGNFKKKFGSKGTGKEHLEDPCDVVLDRKGNIHVCDRENKRVQVFDTDGEFLREYNEWHSKVETKLSCISISRQGKIAIGLDDTHMVILDEKERLEKYFRVNPDGNVKGVCWLDDTHIIVSDHKKSKVRIYDTQRGNMVQESGKEGFWMNKDICGPRGLALFEHEDENYIIVANQGNSQLLMLPCPACD